MTETQKINPMRTWLERHLGKVILASIPVILTMLAGWIYTIGSEIAVIKEKMKADDAQWSALLSANERLRDLEIESRVNKKLLYLLSEKDIDPALLHLDRLVETPDAKSEAQRDERLEDFKVEQMEQIQQRLERK